jgi:hypothetical protein
MDVDFGRLEDGRLLDLGPWDKDKPALVFEGGKWIPFDGTFGECFDSVPLTDEEIEDLRKQGIIRR